MHSRRTEAEWASIAAVATFLLAAFLVSLTGPRALTRLILGGAGLVIAGVLMLVDYRDTVERLMNRIYPPGRMR
jgi:hypothetical protein